MAVTPSLHEATGLSLKVYEPYIDPSAAVASRYLLPGRNIATLTDELVTWQHEIRANGGYWSASFSLSDVTTNLEEWFAGGLGRHVELYNPALEKIWEGFVNRVSLTTGGVLAAERGPLIDIANRVSVLYTPLDTTTSPPTPTLPTTTAITDDTTSQGLYGIWEHILDAGEENAAAVANAQAAYLAEKAYPESNEGLSFSRAGNPSLDVECLGYRAFLDAGVYIQTGASGTIALETKLGAILDDAGADPNGLFASTNASLFAAGILVKRYENDSMTPTAIIKSLVAKGDGTANDGRTIWGVYNDRYFVYDQIPTTVEYHHTLTDAGQRVELVSGTLVRPWDVRAGKWVFVPDFLVGRAQPTANLRDDPRNIFIERVTYTAPFGLDIDGGKVGTLAQVIARLGLGGIG